MGLEQDHFVVCGDCLQRKPTAKRGTILVAPGLPTEVLVDIGTEALASQAGRCFRCGDTIEDQGGFVVEVHDA